MMSSKLTLYHRKLLLMLISTNLMVNLKSVCCAMGGHESLRPPNADMAGKSLKRCSSQTIKVTTFPFTLSQSASVGSNFHSNMKLAESPDFSFFFLSKKNIRPRPLCSVMHTAEPTGKLSTGEAS